jgi:hypothetical protein
MSDCRKIRKIIVEGLPGEPGGREIGDIQKHLRDCPECRRTSSQIERLFREADAARADIQEVMRGVDWDTLSRRIADAAFARRDISRTFAAPRRSWGSMFAPRLRPILAGLAAGLVIGAAAMFFVLQPRAPRPAAGRAYFAPSEFLDQVEYELAKRETIEYLNMSQLLILDAIQGPPTPGWLSPGESSSGRLRDVLAKKRYLNQQLDKVKMAKAREICDQIELLLLELSQISDTLTADEAAKVRAYVEQKQLLLKINLLRKELRESEV